jgi:hypothetical protein
MVQRTKDDMAKQLGGIMQKKQADQQKRASQMGIAANPAPNMAGMGMGMANGGIVGFAGPDGSEVKYGQHMTEEYKSQKDAKRREEQRARYQDLKGREGKLNYMEVMELERLSGLFAPTAGAEGPSSEELAAPAPEPMIDAGEAAVAPQVSDEIAAQQEEDGGPPATVPIGESEGVARLETRVAGQNDQAEITPESLGLTPPAIAPTTPPAQEGIASIPQPKQLDYSSDTAGKGLEDKFRGLTDADPEAAFDKVRKEALGTGYSDEFIKKQEGRIKSLEDMYAASMDPDKLRQEEARAFLAAGSQGTGGGIGTVLGRASRGAAAARKKAKEAGKNQVKGLMSLEQGFEDKLVGQRQKAFEMGQTEKAQIRDQIASGLEGLSGVSDRQRRAIEKFADRKLTVDVANAKTTNDQIMQRQAQEFKAAMEVASLDLKGKIAALQYETDKEKNQLYADAQKALRDVTDSNNKQTVLARINETIGKISVEVDKMYLEAERKAKLLETPEQVTQEIARIREERSRIKSIVLSDLTTQQQQLEQSLPGVSMTPR